MFNYIKKRNSRKENFDINKIINAITKAGKATGSFGEIIAKKLALRVLSLSEQMLNEEIPTVEQIQDIVEEVLLNSPYKAAAKAYILYRDQHSKIREIVSKANVKLIDKYLHKEDWQVKENSNMSYSLQGLNNYLASEISKVYWLNEIYPNNIKQAHNKGELHIHDLGLLSVYCVGWDLIDLLKSGFKGVAGKIASKPPKHFRSALGQIVNFFYTLQGEAAGAQAFSSFDTLLAPFIKHDNLTYKQVKQAMQEFIFNINVPTRVGFQTPFTNITLDLKIPETYKNHPVILGGKELKSTYGEYQNEVNMINKAFLEVMTEGDANGRVFTFPIPTYNITENFDWDDENIEFLWEATAKYGIPYFSNFVNSDMDPSDARSMCCRLRIDNRELEKRGGGLFGANPLTGSIGVVTINLPRIGYKADNLDDFYSILDNLMDEAMNSLEIKRKVLEKLTDSGLYPYTKFYLRDIRNRFKKYWKNHFSTIGLVGMNEACENLFGHDIGTDKGNEFAQKVLNHMRTKLISYQQETGNNYNLEATPAEGTTYRLAQLDLDEFPDIITANKTENSEPFYSNSSQLPVNYSSDLFEVLDKQDAIQTKYTGGTVLHLFAGERISNPENVKQMVKKICHNYHLPYFTFSPTFSICPTHGYIDGEHKTCKKCGSICEVYSRIVGYLRPTSQWNDGKKSEFDLRKTFVMEA